MTESDNKVTPFPSPPVTQGGSGNGGDSRLRALEVRLTRMDEQLRSITENMAGQKDIKLAVANLKIWILTGVLSAIVICTGIAIAILKVFPNS